jgi:hypothetical protein
LFSQWPNSTSPTQPGGRGVSSCVSCRGRPLTWSTSVPPPPLVVHTPLQAYKCHWQGSLARIFK